MRMAESKNSYNLYGIKKMEKPLPTEEQNQYLELAAQGDINAQEKILKHNLRLVCHVINTYFPNLDYNIKE